MVMKYKQAMLYKIDFQQPPPNKTNIIHPKKQTYMLAKRYQHTFWSTLGSTARPKATKSNGKHYAEALLAMLQDRVPAPSCCSRIACVSVNAPRANLHGRTPREIRAWQKVARCRARKPSKMCCSPLRALQASSSCALPT